MKLVFSAGVNQLGCRPAFKSSTLTLVNLFFTFLCFFLFFHKKLWKHLKKWKILFLPANGVLSNCLLVEIYNSLVLKWHPKAGQTDQISDNWLKWGSEIRPFKIRKHSKSGLFEGQISNDPNHSKTRKKWRIKSKLFYI